MKKNIINNFLFDFKNAPCLCHVEERNTSPNSPTKKIFKVSSLPVDRHYFAYAPQKGLCLTSPGGGELKSDILAQLLAIRGQDHTPYVEFFNNYGFLVNLPGDEYLEIDFSTIKKLLERIKALIKLISALNGNPNYDVIFQAVTYLLFNKPISLFSSDESTEIHAFTTAIYETQPFMYDERHCYYTRNISVADMIYEPTTSIDISHLNEIRSSEFTPNNPLSYPIFKNIVALHISKAEEGSIFNLTADFYFHYYEKVGFIKQVTSTKLLYHSEPTLLNFDHQLKAALLIIAKDVIAKEINFNIKGIHPIYSLDDGSPKWHIDNLLQAIYFSIFYLKPGTAIYKPCANPNCKHDKFFLVSSTKTNREYCCDNCRIAAGMQRSRSRKKES